MKILEVITTDYNDASWVLTFYFVAIMALISGIIWTYVGILKKQNKKVLKENEIYNHSEDVIETELKKKTKK